MFHLPMTFGSTLEVEGDFWNKQQTWKCFIATYICPDISEQDCALPRFGLLGWLRSPQNYCPLWAGHTCNHLHKHKRMHPHREAHCISIYIHTHAHTHTHTHTHARMNAGTNAHTKIQSYTGTHREKLTSNFHRISQAENNIALYLVPCSVHSPRNVETNLKDLQLHYEICLHTHTPRTPTVFTLRQSILSLLSSNSQLFFMPIN